MEPGAVIAEHYVLTREIGRGAAAIVFLARDRRHDRDVALKLLRPELASAIGRERFLREIRLEAGLLHPNILPVFDSGAENELLYYVTPYIAAGTLRDRLRGGPLSRDDACQIAIQTLAGLGYAHERHIVHRDIKPENILLDGGRTFVADFGIARVVRESGEFTLTTGGVVLGTPVYMSPEQAAGERDVDARTDLYSLGCVLFEMLTGDPPFVGESARSTMAAHISQQPPRLGEHSSGMPARLDAAVARALQKSPSDRFSSAAEFAAELAKSQAVRAPRPSVPTVVVEAAPARRARWWAIALISSVAVAGILFRVIPGPKLAANRIAVFPPLDPGGAGEDAATYLGHVLEGTDPLRWVDARDWSAQAAGAGAGQLSPRARRDWSRRNGCAWFIDGAVVRGPDSVTVVLRLHDARGDSVAGQGSASGPAPASVPLLAAAAVGRLLPPLLAPGQRVDPGELAHRSPVAVTQFLRGDAAWRQLDLETARARFAEAYALDSSFAQAALRGATAAAWINDYARADSLASRALKEGDRLSLRDRAFAAGLVHYAGGRADSALQSFRLARAKDAEWTPASMAIGEVFFHLLPIEVPAESLAADAFQQVLARDSAFTPALFHATQLAAREGDRAAVRRLAERLRKTARDSAARNVADLLDRCVAGTLDLPSLREVARRAPADVLELAKTMATARAHQACAATAFRTLLDLPEADRATRFHSLLGLQSLIVLAGRTERAESLLRSPLSDSLHGQYFLVLDAQVSPAFDAAATRVAQGSLSTIESLSPRVLWLLGTWQARRGDVGALRAIMADLSSPRRAADPEATWIRQLLAPYLSLAQGDTAQALASLGNLSVRGTHQQLAWSPLHGSGLERVRLAEVRMARGDRAGAVAACRSLESPAPLVFALYLGPCLEITAKASTLLGDRRLAERAKRWLTSARSAVADSSDVPGSTRTH